MEWFVVLIVGLTLLLDLFLSGAPIFIAFMIINVVGTPVYFGPAGFGMFANSLYDTSTFPTLIAVPLFILMGESPVPLRDDGRALQFARQAGGAVPAPALLPVDRALDHVRRAVGRRHGCRRDARAFAVSRPDCAWLRPSEIDGDDPRRSQPRSDHPAQHPGDHHREPGPDLDRQAADRRDHPGADPGRPVPRLHHPAGGCVRALPVHRSGGADAGGHPDLHAAVATTQFRSDMVLAVVPHQHHAGRNNAAVRIHHVRLQGSPATRSDGGYLQRVMALRVYVPDRNADFRRFPRRDDLAAEFAPGAGLAF